MFAKTQELSPFSSKCRPEVVSNRFIYNLTPSNRLNAKMYTQSSNMTYSQSGLTPTREQLGGNSVRLSAG